MKLFLKLFLKVVAIILLLFMFNPATEMKNETQRFVFYALIVMAIIKVVGFGL